MTSSCPLTLDFQRTLHNAKADSSAKSFDLRRVFSEGQLSPDLGSRAACKEATSAVEQELQAGAVTDSEKVQAEGVEVAIEVEHKSAVNERHAQARLRADWPPSPRFKLSVCSASSTQSEWAVQSEAIPEEPEAIPEELQKAVTALEMRWAPVLEMPKQLASVLELVTKILNLIQSEHEHCGSQTTRRATRDLVSPRTSQIHGRRLDPSPKSSWHQRPSSYRLEVDSSDCMTPPRRVSSFSNIRTLDPRPSVSHTMSSPAPSVTAMRPSISSLAGLCAYPAQRVNLEVIRVPSDESSQTLKDSGDSSSQMPWLHTHSAYSNSTQGSSLLKTAAKTSAISCNSCSSKDSQQSRSFSNPRSSRTSCAAGPANSARIPGLPTISSPSGLPGMAAIKEMTPSTSGNKQDSEEELGHHATSSERKKEDVDKLPSAPRRCYSLKGPSTDNMCSINPENEQWRYMVSPSSVYRLFWDALLIGCTAFLAAFIPWALVYSDASLRSRLTTVILYVVDVILIVDIAINFRTGRWIDGHLVLNPLCIAAHYARSWLLFDILSAWPLVSVMNIDSGLWYWFPHCLKLVRLVRLPKLLSHLKKETRWKSLTPIRIGLLVSLALHVVTCFWRVAQRQDDMDEKETWGDTYVQDLYWVIMTVTTVGYGDIHPKGIHTRAYAILLMCVSSVCFGATVSALTHMSKNFFNDEVEHRVAMATNSMRERHVPLDLQRRVQSNLRKILKQDHAGNALDLPLTLLSPALQRELLLSLLSETVLHFPLFNGAQRSFLAEIAQAHKWTQCSHSDLILSTGQVIQEVFFIIHGRLLVRSAGELELQRGFTDGGGSFEEDMSFGGSQGTSYKGTQHSTNGISDEPEHEHEYDQGTSVVDLQPTFRGEKEMQIETGAWFGEACLFMQGVVSSSTIVAACDAELATLAECDYTRIIQKYPRLLAKHHKISKAIRKGTFMLEDLAYNPLDHENLRESIRRHQGRSASQVLRQVSNGAIRFASMMRNIRGYHIRIFPTSGATGRTSTAESRDGFSVIGIESIEVGESASRHASCQIGECASQQTSGSLN